MSHPTIDFSTLSRQTAREYALHADSRILDEKHRRVLNQVARGGKAVDAYALNEAVTAAMRACATRFGQSMARREATRKVAYLGHITQAVIEAHADGLPEYDSSVMRSRAVKDAQAKTAEVQRALDHQGEVNQSLTRDLTEARRSLETSQGAYAALHTAANDQVDILNARIAEVIVEKTAAEVALEDAEKVNSDLARAVQYAVDLLVEAEAVGSAHQVLGFLDALGIEINDEA